MSTYSRRLSPMKQRILDYIAAYEHYSHFSPTQDEIASYCNISQPAVSWHLRELEQRGYVTRDPRSTWRNVRLTAKAGV